MVITGADYNKAIAWFAQRGYGLSKLSEIAKEKYGKMFMHLSKEEINEIARGLNGRHA